MGLNLDKVSVTSKKMLANFIDAIGLDGEFYVSNLDVKVIWGTVKDSNAFGEYITPETARLESQLRGLNLTDDEEEQCRQNGIIIVSQELNGEEEFEEVEKTIIHELIHASRNFFLHDVIRKDEKGNSQNEYAYEAVNVKNGNIIEQNTVYYNDIYADISQEVLKGSIDTSYFSEEPTNVDKSVIEATNKVNKQWKRFTKEENRENKQPSLKEKYEQYENYEVDENGEKQLSEGEIIDENTRGVISSRMEEQQIVDEALVELITNVAWELYENEGHSKEEVWEVIDEVKTYYSGTVATMADIILKHKNFELFEWMLDPLSFSVDDIHYDFFAKYTEGDLQEVSKLYEEGKEETEEMADDIVKKMEKLRLFEEAQANNSGIQIEEVRKVATSAMGLGTMDSIFNSIQQAFNERKKEHKER